MVWQEQAVSVRAPVCVRARITEPVLKNMKYTIDRVCDDGATNDAVVF